jgi:hypothetical protein
MPTTINEKPIGETSTIGETTSDPSKFYTGRYGSVCQELDKDCARMLPALTAAQRCKLLAGVSADLGRLASAEGKLSLGKLSSKDRTLTIREVCKFKFNLTPALAVLKTVDILNQLHPLWFRIDKGDLAPYGAVAEWLVAKE